MDVELLIKVLLAIVFGFAGGWIVKSVLASSRLRQEERDWRKQLETANEAREAAARTVRQLQTRCNELESSFASLQSEMTGIRDNMQLREKSVSALRADLFDAKAKIEEVDALRIKLAERDEKLIELSKARAELTRQAMDTSGFESMRAELDMLSTRAAQLETMNAELVDERSSLTQAVATAERKLRAQKSALEPNPAWTTAGSGGDAALVATLERKVNQREAVIDKLRGELESSRKHVSTFQQKLRQLETRTSETGGPTAVAEADDQAANAGSGQQGDDLTRIRGIGPKLASALNELGIVSYHQLAEMGESELGKLSEQLTSFKDRPTRDDWIGQAKGLVNVGN